MKISKQEFYYILEILVHDDLINNFQCCKNENVIRVCSGGGYDAVYHFNKKDILIDPQIYEVQHQIEKLEKELKKLKKIKENLLTTNQ